MRKFSTKFTKSWPRTLVCLCALILCASIIIAVSMQSGANSGSLNIGKQAPEFRLSDFDGNEVLLYDIVAQNEYVLLEFWASWCGPCVAKLPELKTVYSQYDGGLLEVISIAREESHLEWTEATTTHDLPWINLAELGEMSGDVGAAYGLRRSGLPLNYLLSKDGIVVAKNISVKELETVMRADVSMLEDDSARSEQ